MRSMARTQSVRHLRTHGADVPGESGIGDRHRKYDLTGYRVWVRRKDGLIRIESADLPNGRQRPLLQLSSRLQPNFESIGGDCPHPSRRSGQRRDSPDRRPLPPRNSSVVRWLRSPPTRAARSFVIRPSSTVFYDVLYLRNLRPIPSGRPHPLGFSPGHECQREAPACWPATLQPRWGAPGEDLVARLHTQSRNKRGFA